MNIFKVKSSQSGLWEAECCLLRAVKAHAHRLHVGWCEGNATCIHICKYNISGAQMAPQSWNHSTLKKMIPILKALPT